MACLGLAACGQLVGASPYVDAGAPDASADDGSDINDEASVNDPPDDDASADVRPDAPSAGHRYVFVSSQTDINGAFGTRSAAGANAFADNLCTTEANAILPGSQYTAFLPGMNPLAHGDSWYLPGGQQVFDGATPPSPGAAPSPSVPISQNVRGLTTNAISTWTGASGKTCNGWTSAAFGDVGGIGDPHSIANWQDNASTRCPYEHRFYCFER